MERKSRTYSWSDGCLAVVYFVLALGMYYFVDEYVDLGIHFMYKHILALLLIALSILVFLVRTDLKRGGDLLHLVALQCLPSVVILMASVPLWVFQTQRMTLIRRGVFNEVYGLFIIMAVAGMLYAFGTQGAWLNLAAMVGANFITLVRVVSRYGLPAYLQELRTLIVSFANETGPIMKRMELHELTFALGVYLVYYILNWKECRKNRLALFLLGPTLFFFLSGFKRIGVAAVAAAVALCLVLRVLTRRRKGAFWLMAASFAVVIVLFLYLILVERGIFDYISEHFGVDTMGRRELSHFIDEYYWIGPDFFGYGAGFVARLFYDLPEEYSVRALHNDILMIYIDAGFWGFWGWMLCYLPLRVHRIYRQQGQREGIMCLCLQVYVLATAVTDNTLYYTYVIGALSACVMGGLFHGQEEDHTQEVERL